MYLLNYAWKTTKLLELVKDHDILLKVEVWHETMQALLEKMYESTYNQNNWWNLYQTVEYFYCYADDFNLFLHIALFVSAYFLYFLALRKIHLCFLSFLNVYFKTQ